MVRTPATWYPEPYHQLRDADEDQVVRWIGGWLMDAAPDGWRRIDLTVRLGSALDEIVVAIVMPDGSTPEIEPPPDVKPLLYELRQKKYFRGRGTWLSLRMLIEPSGDYNIFYNFDLDPLWDPPIPAEDHAEDIDMFPRDEEWVPDWHWKRVKGDDATGGRRIPDEPDALVQGITDYLKLSLPAGWHRLQLRYRASGEHEAFVQSINGAERPWTPPEPVIELFRRHRAVSGTWRTARYQLRFPVEVDVRFEQT